MFFNRQTEKHILAHSYNVVPFKNKKEQLD